MNIVRQSGKKVIWLIVRRTILELFMNNVRQDYKIVHLANILANCSPKCTAVFGIENMKITVSSSHYVTARYTLSDLNLVYGNSSVRYGTAVRNKYGTVWFVFGYGTVPVRSGRACPNVLYNIIITNWHNFLLIVFC